MLRQTGTPARGRPERHRSGWSHRGSPGGDPDIAVWCWYGRLARGLLYDAATFLQVQDYGNVQRWAAAIDARPAVQRGCMVNRITGDPAGQLHERHDAGDFLTNTQDKLAPTESK